MLQRDEVTLISTQDSLTLGSKSFFLDWDPFAVRRVRSCGRRDVVMNGICEGVKRGSIELQG